MDTAAISLIQFRFPNNAHKVALKSLTSSDHYLCLLLGLSVLLSVMYLAIV